jgi:hypothetical protein
MNIWKTNPQIARGRVLVLKTHDLVNKILPKLTIWHDFWKLSTRVTKKMVDILSKLIMFLKVMKFQSCILIKS